MKCKDVGYTFTNLSEMEIKYNLISLNSDAKNSIKDGSASLLGFGSVLAGYFGIPYMDYIGGLIIAGYIFFMAYVALKESILVLLDAVNYPSVITDITKHVQEKFQLTTSEVRIRPLGHTIEAHVNIKLKPLMTLEDALKITDKVKRSLSNEFKIKDVVVIPVTT